MGGDGDGGTDTAGGDSAAGGAGVCRRLSKGPLGLNHVGRLTQANASDSTSSDGSALATSSALAAAFAAFNAAFDAAFPGVVGGGVSGLALSGAPATATAPLRTAAL